MLAEVEASPGKIEDAIERYSDVLKIQPKSSTAHYALGTTYVSAHRVDARIAELRHPVLLNPDQPDLTYSLGLAHAYDGQPQEGLLYLNRAKALCPQSARSRAA